jgi:prevent-host-death family protein
VTTIPLTEAKAKLNELVDEAVRMHERVTITRHGRPAAVLVSVDEWESLQETLFWQAQPGIRESLAISRSEAAAGELHDENQVRAALGLAPAP